MGAGSKRIPSLDGLRAISIVLVLVGHLNGTRGFGSHPWIPRMFGDLGHLGVVVFFVISGFLITTLLLKEHAKTGTISLALFYARRSVRIFPAAFAFLGAMVLADWAGWVHLQPNDLLHSLTYTVNYHVNRSWQIGHLWSLSVEEQFYLLWPLAVLLVGPKRSPHFALLVLAVAPVARLAGRFLLEGHPLREAEMFPMVADSLAAGCLLATIRPWLEQQPAYRGILVGWRWVGLVAGILLLNKYMGYTAVSSIGAGVQNLLIAALVHRGVYTADDGFGRLLNSPALVWVGVHSYSLYLWQQPFLNRHSTHWVCAFPVNVIFALAAAALSYRLLEGPLNNLRQKLRKTE